MSEIVKGLVDNTASLQILDHYGPIVRDAAVRYLVGRAVMLDSQLRRCESPIEQVMLPALYWEFICSQVERRPGSRYAVIPQFALAAGTHVYRLDFLVTLAVDGTEQRVAVECDGHEFHERTKEQAKEDRSRDRAIQRTGMRIFRFTGSEIVSDPYKCAKEVVQTLLIMAGVSLQEIV